MVWSKRKIVKTINSCVIPISPRNSDEHGIERVVETSPANFFGGRFAKTSRSCVPGHQGSSKAAALSFETIAIPGSVGSSVVDRLPDIETIDALI
jgi:hypothetical protein